MSQLYRIKPLEWAKPDYRGALLSCPHKYTIFPLKNGASLRTRYDRWKFKSVEEAVKFANHHHRECVIDDFLESAYQPTTELPTEPGLYWWRDAINRWQPAKVFWGMGELLVLRGSFKDPVAELEGQWIRIPEPEGQP